MARKGILVVGSANMDMVVTTRRFPAPGETVFGTSFGMFPGGKGANQAVAAAKLGGNVHFVGKMGKDIFGEQLSRGMRRDGVRLEGLEVDPSAPTGIALITVEGGGQNEIVVVSGSNMHLGPADVDRHRDLFTKVSVLLVQLEVPLATVAKAVALAKLHGVAVVLNPAPGRKLPVSLLRRVDYLTPNENELGMLTDMPATTVRTVERAALKLLENGVGNVLVTLGSRGCLLVRRHETRLFPAYRVRPVDTTAAGDAFNGALAYSLAGGEALERAISLANAVAGIAVTRMGAQSSMPAMREVKTFMAARRYP